MQIESVEHIDPSGNHVALSTSQYSVTKVTHPDRVIILKRPRWMNTRHHYHVICHWTGVFDLPLESIWCPWGTMYPGAEVEYRLVIEFLRKPNSVPRILRLREFPSLDAVIQAYTEGNGDEGEYYYDNGTKHHIYRFEMEPKQTGDMLCFFMP